MRLFLCYFLLACAPAHKSGSGQTANLPQQTVPPGIVFISGRLSTVPGAPPTFELIALDKVPGRLKTLAPTQPIGQSPYLIYKLTNDTQNHYLPHPLHPVHEYQPEKGQMKKAVLNLKQAEFSFRLPHTAAPQTLTLFEEDSTGKQSLLATLPL